MPFFEAGTERFIRNWKETSVRVVVRGAHLRAIEIPQGH